MKIDVKVLGKKKKGKLNPTIKERMLSCGLIGFIQEQKVDLIFQTNHTCHYVFQNRIGKKKKPPSRYMQKKAFDKM